MHLIDTHAHLFDPDLAIELADVLTRAAQAGVHQVINVATTASSAEVVLAKAGSTQGMFASAGIHPNYAHQAKPDDFDRIRKLVEHQKVVALGETGLDRYWEDCPWDIQLNNFQQHIQLSRESGLPLIIHTRDCYDEMIQLLAVEHSNPGWSGVMHSFAGTQSDAVALLELGLYISFAGMLTFKKSQDLRDTARTIPLDRLLVETDCPYLSPEPFRGKRPNEPARVVYTAGVLGDTLGLTLSEIAEITTANARRLFAKITDETIQTL